MHHVKNYSNASNDHRMVNLNPIDIIRKKRDGKKLMKEEIEFLISSYTHHVVPDYQFASFLMAVYFQGMDIEETTTFMQTMLLSGKVLDLSSIRKPKVDKHSTGGVGDKVSLILAPLIASCGVCVPMISGRSLGHTGGTLDKLESIPGFSTNLSLKEFKKQLKICGVAMIGQTSEVTPADKKIYALRDVTATVDSIPLISASILSKKLVEDIDGLVLDVKFGSGAFMQDYRKAKSLARTLVQIGRSSGIKTIAILTDMNNPLGIYIGNSLEVIEAIEALKGRGSKDLMEVTYALGKAMLKLAKIRGGKRLLEKKISSGEALENFKKLVCLQKGDALIVEDYSRLPVAKNRIKTNARKTGYIHHIDSFKIGMLFVVLGGGRLQKEDEIDVACGFRINKKIGDFVKKGECLIEIYSDDKKKARTVQEKLSTVFKIYKKPCPRKKLVREFIS